MNLKRNFVLVGAAVAALVLGSANSSSAAIYAGYGTIWNSSNSVAQCLATPSSTDQNSFAIMWHCDTETGQGWKTNPLVRNGGSFQILNEINGCLSSVTNDNASAVAILQGGCSDRSWWSEYGTVGNYKQLRNDVSGLCLSVAGGSIANGAKVILWPCHETPDQLWGGAAGEL